MRLVLLALLLAGCAGAPKPPCPVISIHVLPTPAGPLFILDEQNLNVMRERMNGLAAGTCSPGDHYGVDAGVQQ